MSKGRYRRLYESFVFGPKICSISMEAEMFFWRVYSIADDYGNFETNPILLAAKAGGLRKFTSTEVQGWIKEMEKAGLIKLYQVKRTWYGHFISFTKYQVPSGPAQNPNGGMLRFYPESPWDELLPNEAVNGQLLPNEAVAGQLLNTKTDIKQKLKNKEILNTNTNTKQNINNIITSSREGRQVSSMKQGATAQSQLFSDDEIHSEVSNTREYDFIQEVFRHWQKVCDHPQAHLSPERRDLLKRRFRDSSLEEMKRAIDGCASSDFHMGRQPNNPVRYNDLTLILRNRTKVEFFMEKITHNPKVDQKAERKRKSDEARAKWYSKK